MPVAAEPSASTPDPSSPPSHRSQWQRYVPPSHPALLRCYRADPLVGRSLIGAQDDFVARILSEKANFEGVLKAPVVPPADATDATLVALTQVESLKVRTVVREGGWREDGS